MPRKAEEEPPVAPRWTTTTTPRGARPADAQQTRDRQDMALGLGWLAAGGRGAVGRRRVPVGRLRARPVRAPADQLPGGLGGLLLGFLLGPALPGPVGPAADPHRGPERLLVVRSALLDLV